MNIGRYTALHLNRRGSILEITLSNPPVNAISLAMHQELATVFEDVARDDDVKVVLLTGDGERAFSAGGDIEHMKRLAAHPGEMVAEMLDARRIVLSLLRLHKPVIARVNGHAIGLGATLALCCDLIYAVESAKLGDPHVAVGLAAGDGGALLWPQLMGYPRAREYLLTGDPIQASDAARFGLINRAVPMQELDGLVYGMADRLAAGATRAINWTKVAINLPLVQQMQAVIDAHLGFEFMSNTTSEHREGIEAFLTKRPPHFR
jgi:enoyl-CoA hydratase